VQETFMTLRELRDAIDGLGEDAAESYPAVFLIEVLGCKIRAPVEMAVAERDIINEEGNVAIGEGSPYLRYGRPETED
jgi:hypothetical protein